MTKNDRIADLETDRDTAFLRIESAEKYAADLAKRLNSAEQNLVDHEQAIGRIGESQNEIKADHRALVDDHGKVVEAIKTGEMRLELNARRIEEVADKTAQRLDGHRTQLNGIIEHLRTIERLALKRPLDENIGLTDKVAALEARLGKYEESVGSWRRATEAVGGRLTGHDAALNTLEAGTRKRIDKIVDDIVAPYCARVRELEKRYGKTVERLEALRHSYIAGERYREKLRNGPKSYDKRIAALEAAVADRRSANEERLDHSSRLVEQLFTRVAALERRDDDPLRHVHWSSVPYSGTGDDATDDEEQCDCFMHGGDTRGDVCTPDDDPTEPTFDNLDEYILGEMRRGRLKREAEFISPPGDLVSRDVDSRVDQTAIALRDFTNVALLSELLRRVSPHRSK